MLKKDNLHNFCFGFSISLLRNELHEFEKHRKLFDFRTIITLFVFVFEHQEDLLVFRFWILFHGV